MNLNIKKAKWTSQSKQFFNTSEDNSVVLDVIISLSCKSQTGNGFEELVNALNDESINRKLKQVNILDTTYLYRHFYPDFKKFTNVSIPTEWYLTNKEAIERIKAKVVLKNWAEEIDNNEFRKYFQQIKQEFEGDKNGNGLLLGFRDTVIHKAAINSYKHKKPFDKCVDFILEECAHLCASFKSETNICYPAKIYSIGESIIKRFSLKINHISYKVHSETDSDSDNKNEKYKTKLNETVLEKAITDFMKQEVTNMNFFVVDTKGNLIYSNFALERFLNNELKAEQIDKEAWKTTSEVIKTGQMFTGEEKGRQGRIYLSMKAPLKIDDKIEGAIGISIDITDSKRIEIEKKRTEELEFLNRIQQIKISFQNEFTQFISQMAHDITSPLVSLEVFTKTCKNLNNDQQHMLAGITSNIRTIADDLLQKYKYNKRAINVSTEQKILISLALSEIIAQKQLQYHDNEKIKILLQYRAMDKFAFIKGNYSNFTRMISNLVNNAVESYKEKKGNILVRFRTESDVAIIEVIDNGEGMSEEKIKQINHNIPIESSKQNGCGLGLHQVMETIRMYNGKLEAALQAQGGTKLIITLPLVSAPNWIPMHINLNRNCTVIILDTDESIRLWKKLFENHLEELNLKVFVNADDAIDFIESLSENEKKNIFACIDYDKTFNSSFNGLDVLLQYGLMKQSLITTSTYHNKQLLELIASSGAKILPKQFLKDAEIIIEETQKFACNY